MGILHPDQYKFLISHSVCLGMRNVSDDSGRENRNTLFTFSNFLPENHDIYKIMWKNIVDPGRPQMPLWFMCIGCWMTKATNTLRMFNNYCFSTAAVVAQMHLNVMLYISCLSR